MAKTVSFYPFYIWGYIVPFQRTAEQKISKFLRIQSWTTPKKNSYVFLKKKTLHIYFCSFLKMNNFKQQQKCNFGPLITKQMFLKTSFKNPLENSFFFHFFLNTNKSQKFSYFKTLFDVLQAYQCTPISPT